jgi:hypothetical protein
VSGLIRTAECSDNDAPTPGKHNSPRSTMRFATVVSLPTIGRGTRAGDRRAGDISGSCPGPCCGCRLRPGCGSSFGAGAFPAPSDAGQRQCDASREACRGQRPVSGRRQDQASHGQRPGVRPLRQQGHAGAAQRGRQRAPPVSAVDRVDAVSAVTAPAAGARTNPVTAQTMAKRPAEAAGFGGSVRASALARHGIPRPRLSVAQVRCHRKRSDYSLLTISYFKLSEA